MKKLAMLAIPALIAGTMSAYAGGVGVVNMKQVFSASPKVHAIKDSLKKRFSSQKSELEKMSNALQADIQKFQKNKTVMSKKDLTALQTKITNEEVKFRQAQSKFQQAVFSAQNAALQKFMANVKAVVKTVATKKGLDTVLPQDAVLYSKNSLDLTQEVINKLK